MLLTLSGFVNFALGQVKDSIQTIHIEETTPLSAVRDSDRDPKKAAVFSAILPGLGQIYNKKSWWYKVPIIYGLGSFIGYRLIYTNGQFKNYRDVICHRDLDSLCSFNVSAELIESYRAFSDDDLKTRRNFYRRKRDVNFIFLTGLYMLQIVDASVEAHLMGIKKIKGDLIMSMAPAVVPVSNSYLRAVPGLSFRINFL